MEMAALGKASVLRLREPFRRGDRVMVVDAPAWCRRYLAGRAGYVARVLPFAGDIWVRFERPVAPWCERMEAVDEFPFTLDQLSAA